MWEVLPPQLTVKRMGFDLRLSQGTGLTKSRAKRTQRVQENMQSTALKTQLSKSFALKFKQKICELIC